MAGSIRVFVNQVVIELPAGSVVLDAVRAAEPQLAEALADGSALVTDGRGLPAPLDARLESGAILRVRASSRSGTGDPRTDDALA